VTAARSAVAEAASLIAENAPNSPLACLVAYIEASRTAAFVADQNIHVHGGIGFTWEHDAHLYYRRAVSTGLFFGGPARDYDAVLAAVTAKSS